MTDPALFPAILDCLPEGVCFVDTDRRVVYWNRAAERLSGFSGDKMLGRTCLDGGLCHLDENGKHLCETGCPLTATLAEEKGRVVHVYLRHAEGFCIPVRVAFSTVRDAEGMLVGAVESFCEDTELREAERRAFALEKFAFIDALTEMPNRRYIEQRLDLRMEEFTRYGWPFGVLLVDVDRFKQINDRHGHEVGDEALRMVSHALQGGMRGTDLVGRWGGEEFLAIVANASPEILTVVAERMRTLVAGSRLHRRDDLSVTISVGVAAARLGDTVGDILRRADANLYRAKELGRNLVWTAEG